MKQEGTTTKGHSHQVKCTSDLLLQWWL